MGTAICKRLKVLNSPRAVRWGDPVYGVAFLYGVRFITAWPYLFCWQAPVTGGGRRAAGMILGALGVVTNILDTMCSELPRSDSWYSHCH